MNANILAALAISTLLASLTTALLYARDKRAGQQSRRRTPERTLLLLSLAGGWPGGLIAGRLLRHKTQKLSYRLKFVACSIVHIVGVIVLLWLVV